MSVLKDTSGYAIQHTVGATTVAVTLTVGSNDNRSLVMLFGVGGATQTVSSVSGGGGGTWTKFSSFSDGPNQRAGEIWSSTNPGTGSQTVTVTFSPAIVSGTDCDQTLYSVYNTDQTTPVSNYASGSAGAGAPSLVVTTSTGNLALTELITSAAPGTANGCTATDDVSDVFNYYIRAANCTGSPTVTFSWPNSGTYGIQGCNVNAGGQVPYNPWYLRMPLLSRFGWRRQY